MISILRILSYATGTIVLTPFGVCFAATWTAHTDTLLLCVQINVANVADWMLFTSSLCNPSVSFTPYRSSNLRFACTFMVCSLEAIYYHHPE